jgi:hypothetical protein
MKGMRTRLTALLFFLIGVTALTIIATPDVAAERIDCVINQSNPDPSTYERIDNVSTQGHYSGATIFHLFCSKNWDRGEGNASFRFVDPGHVQEPDYDTFPNDEKLGREVIDCNYETGGTPGQCGADGDICAFTMSGDQNAHIADCDQDQLPSNTSYQGTLCCSVKELCYDGKDNDGDGLVDCADPECNGADANTALEPFPDKGPQICHNATSCPQTVHVGLEGYWQFENATNDSTTNENDISSTTGTEFTNHLRGKLGQALAFDPGDQATVPDDTSFFETLDPEEALTVSAYVNPDASMATGAGSIIDKDSYELYLSGGEAKFSLETSGTSTINLGSVPQDQWTHLIATYNASTTTMTGYVDGTSTASKTVTGTITNTNDNVTIGSGTAGDYDGRIDEARIYSRELDSTEASSFTNPKCQNRQRTIECINNPELCNTSYNSESGYHCSFGKYDDPQNANYSGGQDGTGVCCPKDQYASYSVVNGWECRSTNQCNVANGGNCPYDINNNESGWFANKSDGSSNACNSQVNDLHEDLNETTRPEGSQACCQVPKKGVVGYWYKDGNVKIYG